MDAHEFATFYPRLAAELRQIQINAMPACVQTPRGPRPAAHVLPEVTFATALSAAVTVWLAIGLSRWDWAAWVWSPATISLDPWTGSCVGLLSRLLIIDWPEGRAGHG